MSVSAVRIELDRARNARWPRRPPINNNMTHGHGNDTNFDISAVPHLLLAAQE